MKTKMLMLIMAVLLLGVAGCEEVARIVADPNSQLNVIVDTVAPIVPAVGAAGAATPWGAIVLAITAAVTALIGVYKTHRKNIVIKGQDANLKNITTATKAVIAAVDALPDDLQKKVKDMVEEKLHDLDDKNFYKIGKAVISGLKG